MELRIVPFNGTVRRVLLAQVFKKQCVRLKSDSPKHKKETGKTKSKRYANTLNLPQTSFPLSMKNGATAQREMEIQKTLGFQSLYQWQRDQKWETEFTLHDGPPYANGKTHVGHVVNKVLKDITNRYKILKRHKVHYVPGWDCHGMPIEMKAIIDKQGQHVQLSPLETRRKAKKFADTVLEEQKAAFKRWGVLGDWSRPYKTMTPEYEVRQLEVFYRIYEKGLIYRDYMPVFWSPSSQSALAEAELEYKPDHVSKSLFVKFPITEMLDQLTQVIGKDAPVFAVIWTTTPWTLPFNQAVCYNPKIKYVFVRDMQSSVVYLCEEAFVERLRSLVPSELQVLLTVEGVSLQGAIYSHPLTSKQLPFLAANHVISGKGTGLVHTAPAHGHDDFQVAVQSNLPTDCHVDNQGTYVSGVDGALLGKTIGVDADEAVISALGPTVIHVEDFTHSYPYDWRTKKPVIIRASKQWFINVPKLRPLALDCLSKVKIIPPQAEHGMISELHSRPYWCISRQRTWGVPIPVFYHKVSGEPLVTRETVDHVNSLIQQHGSDCWWSLSIEELLPNQLLAKLNKGQSSEYEKGEDILDIWFDSGVSWASVLQDVDGQADMYLEGVDQFKGWFQTSLLTSVAVTGKAPYKQIMAHGFATDEEGKKMSKSVGNVVDPEEVINGGKDKRSSPSYGVDVLRWWVAHSHHHQHIMVGPSLLRQFQEDVFKVRKCLRHLIGNLYDFDPSSDLVPYSQLTAVDKYILYVLYTTVKQMEVGYENFSYNRVIQNLEKFTYSDLSGFYINNTRDRCYCDVAESEGRRSSQTVQYHITKALTSAFAPIMPHLAEEIYQHMPDSQLKNKDKDSIFKLGWYHADPEWNNPSAAHQLMPVFDMRRSLMDKLAQESPIEFDVHIYSSPLLHDLLRIIQPEVISSTSSLCEIFQTSQVSVLDSPPPVIPDDAFIVEGSTCLFGEKSASSSSLEVDYKILVTSASLHICERCRRYTAKCSSSPCDRCLDALAHDWST